MGQFSSDVYFIKEAIQKISNKIFRDFVELENLQNSPVTANRFGSMTFEKVKEQLINYFDKGRKNCNLIFKDREIIKDQNSEYRYVINPICGKANFVHSIPYFCVLITVEKVEKNGKKETIIALVDNIIEKETFFAEKGKGAFVNTRRIRVSTRSKLDSSIIALKSPQDKKRLLPILEKIKIIKINNCSPLDIVNTCCGKYDAAIILDRDQTDTDFASLFARESGASLDFLNSEKDLIISNGLLQKDLLDILKA